MSFAHHLLDAAPIHSGRTLIACDAQERPSQIRPGSYLFEQPTGVGAPGGEAGGCRALRCKQQPRFPPGLVRVSGVVAPLRAVGEGEGQLARPRPF